MSYTNRDAEFDSLYEKTKDNDIVFVMAGPAFGITSFLHEYERRGSSVCFYINASTDRFISDELLKKIATSEFSGILQKMADKRFGHYSKTILQAVLECVPYFGPLLSASIEKKSASPVYTGNYMNSLAELLVPLFDEIARSNPVEVIVDAAQDMDESSYSVIAAISSIKKVTVVLVMTDNNDRYIKIKNHLSVYSQLRLDTILFGEPNHHLISELAETWGTHLSEHEISQVLFATKKNIHKIIEHISNYSNSTILLNNMETAIIHLLCICPCGLAQEELCSIIQKSTVFTKNIIADVEIAINKLYDLNLITTKLDFDETKTYMLVGWHHPLVTSCIEMYSDGLYYKNLIYEFYSREGIDETLEKAELMYALSNELSQSTVKMYASIILEKKLKRGEIVPNDILRSADLNKRNSDDVALAALYYCRERRYSDALDWIESMRSKKQIEQFSNLRAVLLNRVRRMDEAEILLDQCIANERVDARLNILHAYSLANTLHLHGSSSIKEKYLNQYEKLAGTANSGYFARNFASAVPFEEKESFYKSALSFFDECRDYFGLYSTYCNWGVSMCANGRAREAYKKLATAEKGLQRFGATHLHIVYNNIGMCHFMNHEYAEAEKYYSLAKRLAINTMPRIMVAINSAVLSLVKGDAGFADTIMEQEWGQIQAHKVISLKRKYYSNMLLVKYATGQDTLRNFVRANSSKLAEYVPEQIVSKYMGYIHCEQPYLPESVHSLYFPSGLAYWYIDPLKLM